jgi:ubiquinone/menaquinone biosynthesis C-methylase UbiE
MSNPSAHTPDEWDEASAHYDANITDFTSNYAEVAAGGGALTLALAPHCAELLSTDYSQGMLDLLQEKLTARGPDNVTCRQMDGMALDVPDATFHRGFCQFGMMLFAEPGAGMSRCAGPWYPVAVP